MTLTEFVLLRLRVDYLSGWFDPNGEGHLDKQVYSNEYEDSVRLLNQERGG